MHSGRWPTQARFWLEWGCSSVTDVAPGRVAQAFDFLLRQFRQWMPRPCVLCKSLPLSLSKGGYRCCRYKGFALSTNPSCVVWCGSRPCKERKDGAPTASLVSARQKARATRPKYRPGRCSRARRGRAVWHHQLRLPHPLRISEGGKRCSQPSRDFDFILGACSVTQPDGKTCTMQAA
jgi:hypothetical protein